MSDNLPFNEEYRLRVLKQYEILDTAEEIAFDNLAALAASVCEAPMACVCLVDEYRQWFKAKVGMDVRETDRCLSFCGHVILKPEEAMIVADATKDLRFCDNELVTNEPYIRFYAGVALMTPEGVPLGALAVMDTEARGLSENQLELLTALAHQVEAQLELRRSKHVISVQSEQLEKAKVIADSATMAKRTFLSNISHEFRTPINGIVGISSLMSSTSLTDQQAEFLGTIQKSAEGLLGIVSNVLDFSKNEIGDGGKSMTRVDTPALVDRVMMMMRPAAMAKGLIFNCYVDDRLEQKLMGDYLKIEQVVSNLVGNALKFTSEGSVELKVKQVGERYDAAVIRFEVKDSGIGIPNDLRLKVFEEFFQVEQGPERNYGGAGLGLSIARQLTRQMDTQINVISEVGVGSTFWFDIAMPYEDAWVKPKNSRSTRKLSSTVGRVLVVEDNDVNAMVLTSMLEKKGCDVTLVSTCDEGLRLLKQGRFDLTFMSVKMPDIEGIQAATAVRRMPFPACMTPIVAMTATIRKEIESLCKSVGINDFMRVPVNESSINRVIDRWLIRSGSVVGTQPPTKFVSPIMLPEEAASGSAPVAVNDRKAEGAHVC
ncbi:MAG: ATP-binding protein [Fimbriimonas sp.]|nr:ATP-binding protein [Fimbriimonas sp.]